MQFNRAELIEEFEGNIRRYGGAFGEWCVGTAKDARGPFFQHHLVADVDDGLAYREAFTTDAAEAVAEHLVNHRGLERVLQAEPGSAISGADTEAERCSARQAVSAPGKIVFVYRKTPPLPTSSPSEHVAFPRRAD